MATYHALGHVRTAAKKHANHLRMARIIRDAKWCGTISLNQHGITKRQTHDTCTHGLPRAIFVKDSVVGFASVLS